MSARTRDSTPKPLVHVYGLKSTRVVDWGKKQKLVTQRGNSFAAEKQILLVGTSRYGGGGVEAGVCFVVTLVNDNLSDTEIESGSERL